MQIPNNYYLGDGPRLTLKQLLLMNGPANSQLIKLPEFKAASRQRNGYLLLCDAMGKWAFFISTLYPNTVFTAGEETKAPMYAACCGMSLHGLWQVSAHPMCTPDEGRG